MKFIYLTGITYFCLPGSHPLIRRATIDTACLHYAKWLLLQLSLESDITMGCFY